MPDKKPTPSPNLTDILAKLKVVFNRHASIVFVILILGAVVYSVSSVNILINTPSDDEYRIKKQQELTSTQFNKETIEKIEALGDRNNPPEPVLPGGRINPFVE